MRRVPAAPEPSVPCQSAFLGRADLKASNQRGRNERLNKTVQSFLYGVLADDNELAAKKSLAVLSELWRRHIWRDGRTVNCIASAVFHKSPAVMAAALKFFLGQDAAAADGDDSDDEDGDGEQGKTVVVAPTKEEVYKATQKVRLTYLVTYFVPYFVTLLW
eukprot:GHRQ01028145.1.p2 GENE.GHRQ01028145.1~~GHRQ01028145.1.p2  ORF type:complete len:161 (+),score=49.20 GHRQ01028145.1:81-563(+)